MRRFLLRFHLIVGLVVGLVLLLMGATGFLLALEPRVTAYLGRHLSTVPMPVSEADREAQRLPLNDLAARAEAALGRRPGSVTLRNDPAAAVAFGGGGERQGGERTVWLDPYTGAVLGESPKGAQKFFRTVEDLHRWLALEGKGRTIGRSVTLAATVGYLLLLASGLFMWDPRFLKDRSGPRRWHKAFGFLMAPLLFVSAATGLLIAINVFVSPSGPGPGGMRMGGEGGWREGGEHREHAPVDFDALAATCAEKAPAWRQITLRLPRGRGPQTVTALIDEGRSWVAMTSRLTIPLASPDAAADAPAPVPKWEPYDGQPGWRQTVTWARQIHKGLYGGWLGTLVTLGVGVATVTLTLTGFLLAWKRLRPRQTEAQA